MDPALRRIEIALARVRRRLRARRGAAGAAVGLQLGLVGAALLVAPLRLAALVSSPVAVVIALLVAAATAALGALVGALWLGVDRRALALLVDRVGGTDELVLTALHVAGTDDPNREAILARVAALDLPALSALRIRAPRHLRWAVGPAALVTLLCFAPPLTAWTRDGEISAVVEEGQRLEERLEELSATDEGLELPEELEREVADLAEELQGESLSPEEALERLDELGEQLRDFEQSMQPSSDLLEDLEQAARELDAEATEDLKRALEQGDMDAAAHAAQELAERLAEATPEERDRAAESMQQAGERLSRSGDPALQQAGSALERAGEQIAEPGDAQGQGTGQQGPGDQPGRASSQAPGGLTPQQARELSNELARARALGEQLQRDRQAMARAQQIRGAMEGSKQRLGGDSEVAQGESSQQGSGSSANGPGAQQQGQGGGTQVGGQQPSDRAGAAHTWEDEGERPLSAPTERADTRSDRARGEHIDDFEKLYEAVRLDDAEALLAGASGRLDDRGHIDELSLRLTEAEEAAKAGTVQLPEAYRAAAAEAIEAEPIPPGYRTAVKDYFDDM